MSTPNSDHHRTFLVAAILVALVALWPRAHADGLSGPAIPTPAQISAMAPVQSVNAQTGNVTVPVFFRQISPPMSVPTNGDVTWPFPIAFTNTPSCFFTLSATTTSFTFDAPLQTAASLGSTSLVEVNISAHPNSLTIASVLTLPITLTLNGPNSVPAGTTVTFSCSAPV